MFDSICNCSFLMQRMVARMQAVLVGLIKRVMLYLSISK